MQSNDRIGVGSRVTIQYTNGQGSVSRRMIDVREVTCDSGYTYIRAWCHTRGEERTFRTDRMDVLRRHPVQDAPEVQGAAAERTPGDGARPVSPAAARYEARRQQQDAVLRRYAGTAAPPPGDGAPQRDGAASSKAPPGDGARPVSPAAAPVATEPQTLPKTPAGFWRDVGLLWSVPILFFIFIANLDTLIAGDSRGAGTASRSRDTVIVTTVDRTAPDPPPQPDPPENAVPAPPDPPPSPPTVADRRQVAFAAETGITDRILTRVYEEADRDGDGTLGFTEIQAFQRWVFREFRYQTNHTALSPERFGALGGGDCEDYSLYTCGLLAYWGYECYVGVFASPDDPDAQLSHAVALLAVSGPVKVPQLVTTDDNPRYPVTARNRTFVPIDYHVVGGFTNATPDPRVLYGIYEAPKIYGTYM